MNQETIKTRKRIRELAVEAGFMRPNKNPHRDAVEVEGSLICYPFVVFDDRRESCYDVRRGKAHKAFVKLMKEEFADAYRMTQHHDYGTDIYLRKAA